VKARRAMNDDYSDIIHRMMRDLQHDDEMGALAAT
jgi:hypothetical protein